MKYYILDGEDSNIKVTEPTNTKKYFRRQEMRGNAFYAATHPAYSLLDGLYHCKCGKVFEHMGEILAHCIESENEYTAERVLSWRQFNKYLKERNIELA